MIKISKDEAELVRQTYPDVYISVTNKQKNGACKTRYVEESPRVMKLISRLRRPKKNTVV